MALEWLRKLNHRILGAPKAVEQDIRVRRWEAAQTDRLNAAHWGKASGQSINNDLKTYLPTMQLRVTHEISTNPSLAGVIKTLALGIVGPDGPRFQLISTDKKWNEDGEWLFNQWWKMPDRAGKLAGPELVKLWVRSLCQFGDYTAQLVTFGREGITLRINNINPTRLQTPLSVLDDSITLGVEHDRFGMPLAYWIAPSQDTLTGLPGDSLRIPAETFLHGFEADEPEQARGVPWVAIALQAAADTNDFKNEVMDSARMANNYGVLLTHEAEDVSYAEANESVDIERGTMRNVMPGWTPHQMKPEQPSTMYKEFQDSRLAEFGRERCMPLMMIKLDSSGHNYSSARFDAQLFAIANGSSQGVITRNTLNRLGGLVVREAILSGDLATPPPRWRIDWQWPQAPHVDPQKEAKAATERLNNGTSTLKRECTQLYLNWEEVIAQQAVEMEAKKTAGLITEPEEPAAPTNGKGNGNGGARALQGAIDRIYEVADTLEESTQQ